MELSMLWHRHQLLTQCLCIPLMPELLRCSRYIKTSASTWRHLQHTRSESQAHQCIQDNNSQWHHSHKLHTVMHMGMIKLQIGATGRHMIEALLPKGITNRGRTIMTEQCGTEGTVTDIQDRPATLEATEVQGLPTPIIEDTIMITGVLPETGTDAEDITRDITTDPHHTTGSSRIIITVDDVYVVVLIWSEIKSAPIVAEPVLCLRVALNSVNISPDADPGHSTCVLAFTSISRAATHKTVDFPSACMMEFPGAISPGFGFRVQSFANRERSVGCGAEGNRG
mmetsp:Transcript_37743/g.58904  ORF Transcript_37743/g.58904 Transcript_37743/m.58904 type:complete len:283 (+) Transcript_37743:488-1336(+)